MVYNALKKLDREGNQVNLFQDQGLRLKISRTSLGAASLDKFLVINTLVVNGFIIFSQTMKILMVDLQSSNFCFPF